MRDDADSALRGIHALTPLKLISKRFSLLFFFYNSEDVISTSECL